MKKFIITIVFTFFLFFPLRVSASALPVLSAEELEEKFNGEEIEVAIPTYDETAIEPEAPPLLDIVSDERLQEFRESHSYCEDDLWLLSHLINGEAGNCDETQMMYVGSVVLNRVNSERYPDTIADVVYQSGQYECTWDGNFDREPCQQAIDVADYLLQNGSILPENVVFQAQFEQGSGIYCTYGNQYYCVF